MIESTKEFEAICKDYIAKYTHGLAIEHPFISPDDVYCVWLCKTLQNIKGLFSTTIPDQRYYEMTYNGDKDELYFDCYVKEKNECIKK